MEKQSLKKAIWILFIAVIFLASYAAFGSTGNNSSQKTTTSTIPLTYPAVGTANAIITRYLPSMSITSACNNASINAVAVVKLGQILSSLSSNGYVSAYYQLNNTYKLEAGRSNATKIYSYISKNISSSLSCTTFSASASIELPQSIKLYYNSGSTRQPITFLVPSAYRNYTIPLNLTGNTSSTMSVRIFALFTANATTASIYNMSIEA